MPLVAHQIGKSRSFSLLQRLRDRAVGWQCLPQAVRVLVLVGAGNAQPPALGAGIHLGDNACDAAHQILVGVDGGLRGGQQRPAFIGLPGGLRQAAHVALQHGVEGQAALLRDAVDQQQGAFVPGQPRPVGIAHVADGRLPVLPGDGAGQNGHDDDGDQGGGNEELVAQRGPRHPAGNAVGHAASVVVVTGVVAPEKL